MSRLSEASGFVFTWLISCCVVFVMAFGLIDLAKSFGLDRHVPAEVFFMIGALGGIWVDWMRPSSRLDYILPEPDWDEANEIVEGLPNVVVLQERRSLKAWYGNKDRTMWRLRKEANLTRREAYLAMRLLNRQRPFA